MTRTRTLLAAVLLAGSALGGSAQAAPGQTCYFGECPQGVTPSAPSTTSTTSPSTPSAGPSTRVVTQPEAPSGSSSMRTLGKHGSWTAVSMANGPSVAIDQFDDGTKLGIAVHSRSKFSMMVTRPKWALQPGKDYTVKVTVDGDSFSGQAKAMDETTLVLEGLTIEFVSTIYKGKKGSLVVGNFEATMNALDDAAAALDDVFRFQTASAAR